MDSFQKLIERMVRITDNQYWMILPLTPSIEIPLAFVMQQDIGNLQDTNKVIQDLTDQHILLR